MRRGSSGVFVKRAVSIAEPRREYKEDIHVGGGSGGRKEPEERTQGELRTVTAFFLHIKATSSRLLHATSDLANLAQSGPLEGFVPCR
jgi:hypothetical protein